MLAGKSQAHVIGTLLLKIRCCCCCMSARLEGCSLTPGNVQSVSEGWSFTDTVTPEPDFQVVGLTSGRRANGLVQARNLMLHVGFSLNPHPLAEASRAEETKQSCGQQMEFSHRWMK